MQNALLKNLSAVLEQIITVEAAYFTGTGSSNTVVLNATSISAAAMMSRLCIAQLSALQI